MFGVSQTYYYFVFLKSAGIGFLIGCFYAFFAAMRAVGINSRGCVIVQDIVFCILASIGSFLLLFDVNAGIFRFYILVGETIGFLLCLLMPVKSFTSVLRKMKCRLSGRKRHGKHVRFFKKTVAKKETDVI